MDFSAFINLLNGYVWSTPLVCLLLGGGLYFSIRTRFVQLRMMHEMVRLIFQPKDDDLGISSFQALSMTLAGRVGHTMNGDKKVRVCRKCGAEI